MSTPTTKAPLEGEITLDSLNPPHGRITGSIDLPAPVLSNLGEVREATGGYTLQPQEFAVVTYARPNPKGEYGDPEFLTIHLGPNDTILSSIVTTYGGPPGPPIDKLTWTKKSGYIIKLK